MQTRNRTPVFYVSAAGRRLLEDMGIGQHEDLILTQLAAQDRPTPTMKESPMSSEGTVPVNPSPTNEGEFILHQIVQYLASVPEALVPSEDRQPMAEEFVEYLGKLTMFMQEDAPLSRAKGAALLFFVKNLESMLANQGEDGSAVIMTIVDAAATAAELLRAARPKDGN